MESIKQVIHTIKSNMYLESLGIKDGFYTVPIYEPHIKYLKFMWLNKAKYQFIVMPNGYVNATRVFSNPVDIYLLKVNNRNTRARCEICSKLTIKAPERCHCTISYCQVWNLLVETKCSKFLLKNDFSTNCRLYNTYWCK